MIKKAQLSMGINELDSDIWHSYIDRAISKKIKDLYVYASTDIPYKMLLEKCEERNKIKIVVHFFKNVSKYDEWYIDSHYIPKANIIGGANLYLADDIVGVINN